MMHLLKQGAKPIKARKPRKTFAALPFERNEPAVAEEEEEVIVGPAESMGEVEYVDPKKQAEMSKRKIVKAKRPE